MKIKILEKIKNKIGLTINPTLHIGKNKSFVFIHINKTAGTSIINVIENPSENTLL